MQVVDTKQRLQTAQWLLERQLAWIVASDAKVAVILTIQVGLLGGLAAAVASNPSRSTWAALLSIASGLLSCFSIFYAARAVKPDTKGPDTSLFFFGRVAALDECTYVDRLMTVSDEDLLRDWAAQVHRNAEIASEKFGRVGVAMIWGFLAALTWVPAIGLLFKLGV